MSRRTLVVGGNGMIGSRIASDLVASGDQVTVMARREVNEDDPDGIAGLPRLVADYASPDRAPGAFEGFDAVVFAAGQDIRHVPQDEEGQEFWDRVQAVGVPAFAAVVKRAGVPRFVQIGSYYHQVLPELAERVPYVAARRDADDGARALTDDGFAAITLNPPSIVGVSDRRGLRRFARMVAWVRGELAEPELFAPAGGTNYMSLRSLSQAVQGALSDGEPGHAYLIGDQNLTYRDYFQLLANVAGSDRVIEERDQESAYQPDRFIVQGRGVVISFEPDAEETRVLGYARDDVRPALQEIVDAVDAVDRSRE